jgi:hypothetical protein
MEMLSKMVITVGIKLTMHSRIRRGHQPCLLIFVFVGAAAWLLIFLDVENT